MAYTIEQGQIVFDSPPPEGAEVEIFVSNQNSLNGFSDPNSRYPRRVREVDTNRLAVNDSQNQHPVVKAKNARTDDLTGEPKSPFSPKYPFNHVKETESGHIVEFDDTPGFERIHEYHRSGTFYEIHPDGTKVTKVVGEDFEIVHKNKSVRVRGNVKVFVDGDASLYVRGSMDAQVDENLQFNVGKNIDFHAGQNIRMFANQSLEMTSQTTMSQISVGKFLQQSMADMQIISGANFTNVAKGNYDMVVDGNYLTEIAGNLSTNITGNVSLNAEGTYTHASTGAMQLDTSGSLNIGSGAAMNLDGSTVDLNSNGRIAVSFSAIVPRATADAKIAPALVFLDSGTIESGIKAWSIDPAEANTDGFAATIDTPKQAEVLPEKAISATSETDRFYGSDDEEKSEDELKAAVASGEIRPTTFSDYSFNSLTGSVDSAAAGRTVTAKPLVPEVSGQHEGGENPNVSSPEAASASASKEETPVANYDANGKYIGGINYNLKLSQHFTLGQLSKNAVVSKYPVQAQHGLKEQELINNLKTLAVHALDPIKNQYPNMFVTSAFRPAKGTSQHERGQAADMQFTGATKAEYYEIAKWIRSNVPHDQILLEFKSTGSGLPWIHLSCIESGNRAKIATFFNHSRYKDTGTFYQIYA
jgi:hypothetical protein